MPRAKEAIARAKEVKASADRLSRGVPDLAPETQKQLASALSGIARGVDSVKKSGAIATEIITGKIDRIPPPIPHPPQYGPDIMAFLRKLESMVLTQARETTMMSATIDRILGEMKVPAKVKVLRDKTGKITGMTREKRLDA